MRIFEFPFIAKGMTHAFELKPQSRIGRVIAVAIPQAF
jgi:hypothetical protein